MKSQPNWIDSSASRTLGVILWYHYRRKKKKKTKTITTQTQRSVLIRPSGSCIRAQRRTRLGSLQRVIGLFNGHNIITAANRIMINDYNIIVRDYIVFFRIIIIYFFNFFDGLLNCFFIIFIYTYVFRKFSVLDEYSNE